MPLRRLLFAGLTALLSGCIPVSEPLSDVSRAEPDQRLVGVWVRKGEPIGEVGRTAIDVPPIEGNPKGLMRVRDLDIPTAAPGWVIPTTIGKEAYLSYVLGSLDGGRPIDFTRPGEYARWHGRTKAVYLILHYRVEGDTLTLTKGDKEAFGGLMKREGFDRPGPGVPLPQGYSPAADPLYYPPPGWLAAYLGKNGPETLFPKVAGRAYTRQQW